VQLEALSDLFEPLVGLYEIVAIGDNRMPDEFGDPDGESLAFLLDEEWGIFSEALDEDRKEILLGDIVNSGKDPIEWVDVTDLWTSHENNFRYRSFVDYWREFKSYLMEERRFIPDNRSGVIAPQKLLREDLRRLAERKLDAGESLYRARLGGHQEKGRGRIEAYRAEEMGTPPIGLCRGGRVNPAGIPFLYLSFSERTAVAEVRPWAGAIVSVARFVVPSDMRIADLTDIPYFKTPFGVPDLEREVENRRLLRYLGEEFARPVGPDSAEVEYVPTQYVAEAIREYGFDGIRYPSALAPDSNLVVFDGASFTAEDVWIVNVKKVKYSFGIPNPLDEMLR
jgi:hypothetical protein